MQIDTEYSLSFRCVLKAHLLLNFHKGDQTNTHFKNWAFEPSESIQSLNQSKSKYYKKSDDNNL